MAVALHSVPSCEYSDWLSFIDFLGVCQTKSIIPSKSGFFLSQSGMQPPATAFLRASCRSAVRLRPPGRRLYATTSSPEGTVGLSDPTGYCTHLVRQRDYESYLISHFWPKDSRASYFAIKAFYVELATMQDHVTNSSLGRMRMQFWRDAIKGVFDVRLFFFLRLQMLVGQVFSFMFLGQTTTASYCTCATSSYTTG